jgi:hypothetical protein
MKNIYVFALALFAFVSCEIEKLNPEDIVDDTPTWEEPIDNTVDPNSIVVPCITGLVNGIIRFNNSNYSVSTVTINPPFAPTGLFNATYSISADLLGTSEMEFFFNVTPTSGYYSSIGGGQMSSPNQVVVRTLQGGSYYYADAGGEVYFQKFTDSVIVSYCDLDFTESFTIPNSKGRFTY